MSCVDHIRKQLDELEEDAGELEELAEDLRVARLLRRLHLKDIEGD